MDGNIPSEADIRTTDSAGSSGEIAENIDNGGTSPKEAPSFSASAKQESPSETPSGIPAEAVDLKAGSADGKSDFPVQNEDEAETPLTPENESGANINETAGQTDDNGDNIVDGDNLDDGDNVGNSDKIGDSVDEGSSANENDTVGGTGEKSGTSDASDDNGRQDKESAPHILRRPASAEFEPEDMPPAIDPILQLIAGIASGVAISLLAAAVTLSGRLPEAVFIAAVTAAGYFLFSDLYALGRLRSAKACGIKPYFLRLFCFHFTFSNGKTELFTVSPSGLRCPAPPPDDGEMKDSVYIRFFGGGFAALAFALPFCAAAVILSAVFGAPVYILLTAISLSAALLLCAAINLFRDFNEALPSDGLIIRALLRREPRSAYLIKLYSASVELFAGIRPRDLDFPDVKLNTATLSKEKYPPAEDAVIDRQLHFDIHNRFSEAFIKLFSGLKAVFSREKPVKPDVESPVESTAMPSETPENRPVSELDDLSGAAEAPAVAPDAAFDAPADTPVNADSVSDNAVATASDVPSVAADTSAVIADTASDAQTVAADASADTADSPADNSATFIPAQNDSDATFDIDKPSEPVQTAVDDEKQRASAVKTLWKRASSNASELCRRLREAFNTRALSNEAALYESEAVDAASLAENDGEGQDEMSVSDSGANTIRRPARKKRRAAELWDFTGKRTFVTEVLRPFPRCLESSADPSQYLLLMFFYRCISELDADSSDFQRYLLAVQKHISSFPPQLREHLYSELCCLYSVGGNLPAAYDYHRLIRGGNDIGSLRVQAFYTYYVLGHTSAALLLCARAKDCFEELSNERFVPYYGVQLMEIERINRLLLSITAAAPGIETV